MANQTATASSSGVGLSGALFLVFLVLKLTGVIAWPWLWVTAPLWIPVVFALAGIAVIVAAHFISGMRRKNRLRNR